MEEKIIDGEIGKEAGYDLIFEDGVLKLHVGYDGKGVDAGIYVNLGTDYFLDKLKAAIPGQIDDTVIDLIKVALK